MNLRAVLTAQDNASATLKSFGDTLKTTGSHLTNVGSAASNVGSALKNTLVRGLEVAGVAAAGLVGGLVSCVKAANESEYANRKMTEMLRNSGKVTEEQIEHLRKYAETIQYKVGIGDEEIKQGIAMLGTFKLTGATIEKSIPALLGMANAYRGATGEMVDLQHWAIMLGRPEALPQLVTMMRRVGIIFTDAQVEIMKTADEETRVKMITEELNKEFGTGTWVTQDFGGKMLVLGLMFDEAKEKMGNALLKGLAPFIDKLVLWVQTDQAQAKIEAIAAKVSDMSLKFSEWMTTVAIPWVQTHWPEIKRVVGEAWDKIEAVIKSVAEFVKKHPDFVAAVVAIGAAMTVLSFFKIPALIGAIAGPGGLIATLGLIPTMIIIGIALDAWLISECVKAIKGLKNDLAGLPTSVKIKISLELIKDIVLPGQMLGTKLGEKIKDLFKQTGGPVFGGKPYIVGEAGPELFVPNTSGKIIPNNQITNNDNGVTVNFYGNINNTSGSSLDDIGARIGRQITLSREGAY